MGFLAWELSLGNVHLEIVVGLLPFGLLRLGTYVSGRSLGSIHLRQLDWVFLLDDFRLIPRLTTFDWGFSLEVLT